MKLNENTGAREDVLRFYEQLPFNANKTPSHAAELIAGSNGVASIYPFEEDFFEADSVLELGCGAGWLSNSISYYYGAKVTGVDFNPIAIEMAKQTCDLLKMDVQFEVNDLFKVECEPHDIVISNGVLHHTSDVYGGVRKCIELAKTGGKVFIGLYHKYGRKPFLDYFEALKQQSSDEQFLFEKYLEIDDRHGDDVQAKSWFLDQVLHPYETQCTLQEVYSVFEQMGVEMIATSINGYEKITDMELLFAMEKELYNRGQMMLEAHKYYPGFFYVLGKKK